MVISPENAKKVMPEFSAFVEYNLKDTGLMASRIQTAVQATKKMAETPKEIMDVIDEFKPLKKGDVIREPNKTYQVADINEKSKSVIGSKISTVEISRRAIKHIVEQHGEQVSEILKMIPEILKNPTKIADNFAKRANSYLFVKMNGKATGVVLEVIKNPDGNRVVSAFRIDKKTYEKLQDISGRPDVPPSDISPVESEISTAQRISNKSIAQPEKPVKFAGTGLKTGKVVKDRLSYNPEKINAPEDVEAIFKGVSAASKEFKEQRISKSDENLQALAKEVDISVDELLAVKHGSVANAETVLKARQIVADLAQDLRDTIRQTTTETATSERLQLVKEKLFRLQGTMKTVAGLRTEASNVFRSFKIEARAGENDILTNLVSELKKLDGKVGDDLSAFIKGSKELIEPTIADKAWHLWYMSILSGESTQIKNAFGNFTQLVGEVVVTATRNPRELPTALRGLYEGLVRGGSEAKKILKEGDISKFEERRVKPIVFTGKASFLNTLDYVGRFMSAVDAFAREGFRGMEASGKAREIALKEGYSGEKLKSRISELKDELLKTDEEVNAFGRRGTYTQKPEGALGVIAGAISSATRKVPLGKLIVPFTRIVANVTNNSLDWTPLGIKRALVKPTKIGGQAYFKEGGIFADYYKDPLTARQRGKAVARGALGTVAMAYFATLATEGNLSGNGPKDYKKRQQLKDAGWRENAIKIGDTWYPYQNWGPMAIPMTLVGNYFDAQKYGNMSEDDLFSRAGLAAFGSVSSIVDMSFLSGVGDLFTAISNPDQAESYLKNFIAQQASSPVPNLFKQTARYFDPTVYETKTIKEKIYSNLRITSGLKPKLNVFGQPIVGEALTQLQPVKETSDQLIRYLAEQQIYITVPSKATKVRNAAGDKVEMTEDQYYEYVKQSGQKMHQVLSERLEYIKLLEPDRREKYIDDTVSRIREEVKYTFYGK